MTLTPFIMDQERADMRAALIAMSIWNVQIAKNTKKGETPQMRMLYEFLPHWGDAPEQTPPSLSPERQFESIVNAFESMGLQPIDRQNNT